MVTYLSFLFRCVLPLDVKYTRKSNDKYSSESPSPNNRFQLLNFSVKDLNYELFFIVCVEKRMPYLFICLIKGLLIQETIFSICR